MYSATPMLFFHGHKTKKIFSKSAALLETTLWLIDFIDNHGSRGFSWLYKIYLPPFYGNCTTIFRHCDRRQNRRWHHGYRFVHYIHPVYLLPMSQPSSIWNLSSDPMRSVAGRRVHFCLFVNISYISRAYRNMWNGYIEFTVYIASIWFSWAKNTFVFKVEQLLAFGPNIC